MPATTTSPPIAAGLRLLLFGLPGSGKSSLLGALVQAAGSQGTVLRGKLADDTGRLDALRQRTYAGTPPATTDEVVAYPVHFEPQGQGAIAATLLDSDGRLAQQYLSGSRPLVPRDSALARAMLEADTVILTLDAAIAKNEVEAQLATFRRFLTLLQDVRSRRADVADLPVYLVLTKCDQLAKPDDTFSKWQQHIEEAKRRLGERFAAFLSARPAGPAFGTINLHLWATAVRRPPLAGRPAPADEPYGVAELFRQCLGSALGFDRREAKASRRLEWAVGSLGLLVVLMALLSAVFALTQPDTELIRLEDTVQAALPDPDAKEAKARLRGDLPERLKQLERIVRDPAFEKLPARMREAVRESADEIDSYLRTREAFRTRIKQPYQAKNEAELDRFEKEVRQFALPPPYADAWARTGMAEQLAKVRAEYASVRSAIVEEVQWIQKQMEDGKNLDDEGNQLPAALTALDPTKKQEARQKAKMWLAAAAGYENRPYLRLPGDQPIAGTISFTYADLRKFQAVRAARKEWEEVKSRLDETYKYVLARAAK